MDRNLVSENPKILGTETRSFSLRDLLSHRTQHALLKVVADALNRKEKSLPRKYRHKWRVFYYKWIPGDDVRMGSDPPFTTDADGSAIRIDGALDILIDKIRNGGKYK